MALRALVDHIAEAFEPVVEDARRRLKVTIVAPARIQGDWDLLVQMTGNPIQGALRYGVASQEIALSAQGAILCVADQGSGIPPTEQTKVLRPLYRNAAE